MNTQSSKRKANPKSPIKAGNKVHLLAKGVENNGRPMRYTPDTIRKAFDEYTKYIDANPWKRAEVVKSGEHVGELLEVPTKRPYTLMGFCLHVEMSRTTFHEYSLLQDFAHVCKYILDACYQQKFEGAASGYFNANIIARDLGLIDKQENTVKVVDVEKLMPFGE